MDHKKPKHVLFLVGPTAAGKTDAALAAARELNAEIVSADSMQVYRTMDIATAKPSLEERARVPHHLIDILDPSEEFNAASFARLAREMIGEIHGRGKRPLVTGGTPLYLKALAEGLFSSPPTEGELRRKIEDEYDRLGPERMHERLEAVDPETAARFHANDRKRIVRALEVYELTGIPISAQQQQFGQLADWMTPLFVGLQREREDLYKRIDARVDKMIADGLVGEVKEILSRGGFGPQSSFALGYREIAGALAQGNNPLDVVEDIKRNTRHMARKQLTWFKHMPYVKWIDVAPNDPPELIAAQVISAFKDLLAQPRSL